MTEKELNDLVGVALLQWDEPYRPIIRLFGEGIRQLTRIADAMKNVESNDSLRATVEIHGTGG